MKIVVVVRVAAILIAISCINASLRVVRSSVWHVRHVLIASDDVFSLQAKNEIESFVHLMENEGTYNPTTLVSLLMNQFPCIKDISVQRLAYNTAEFSITAYEPCARVNQSHVLIENGLLVCDASYNIDALALCPFLTLHITPLPQSLPEQMLATLMGSLKNDYASYYHLVVINEHEMRFYDKDAPNFYVVCDAMQIPEQTTLDRCQDLKKKLLARSGTKQQKNWRADIRFHDQIVVSMEKGGDYGSYIS